MNAQAVRILVAVKAKLNLAQDTTLIDSAITSALEEIGVQLKIADAIMPETKTISASSNYVTWNREYSQLVSVVYQYTSGSATFTRPLTSVEVTQYDIENAGLQSQTTDFLSHYCRKGDRIYVGPGNSYSGGSLVIEFQRKLTMDDIEKLPDSYMVIWGALSNLLPVDNPAQAGYRTLFVSRLVPATTQAKPTLEKHNKIQMNDQILRDEAYLRSL